MSFEGYFQCLCEDGHENTHDVYEWYDVNEFEQECSISGCKKKIAWWTIIDETNGADEESGEGIAVVFEELIPADNCKCQKCGHEHLASPMRYKFPCHSVGHLRPDLRKRVQSKSEIRRLDVQKGSGKE